MIRARNGHVRDSLLIAVGLLLGCETEELTEPAPSRARGGGALALDHADRAALGLEVARVKESELPDAVLRLGVVIARPGDDATVSAPMPGKISKAPTIQLGSQVEAGASLIEISPVLGASERASLGVQAAELGGQIEQTESELALRKTELQRARELATDRIISAAKLQEAETAVVTTQARLQALRRARSAHAGGAGRPIVLRAPVAGTVVALNSALGRPVQTGDVLARILRPGPRLIDVSLPSGEPPAVAYEVEIGARWVPARPIAYGEIVAEDGSRHDRLEIDAAEASALTPGATVSIRLGRDMARGIVVPETALVPGAGGDTVFVETEPGEFELRPVRVAARFGGNARLASGVAPGEVVVIRGAMALRGELVRSQLGEDDD